MHFQIRHKYDKSVQKCLKYVLSKCQIGDWFVLYQLCRNSNPYFYRDFIKVTAVLSSRLYKYSNRREFKDLKLIFNSSMFVQGTCFGFEEKTKENQKRMHYISSS